MKIYPYGENGITNSLLEAFYLNPSYFYECITRLVQWIDGDGRRFQRGTLRPKFVIQQPGFGRQGFGEPDGLIAAGRYVFYLEAKALPYDMTFRANISNFEKLIKYFSIADSFYKGVPNNGYVDSKVIIINDDGTTHIVPRKYGLNNRPAKIRELLGALKKHEYYFLILTMDEAEAWEAIREHYRTNLDIIEQYKNQLGFRGHYRRRFGWLPLRKIFCGIADRKEWYFLKLRNAFLCNGLE